MAAFLTYRSSIQAVTRDDTHRGVDCAEFDIAADIEDSPTVLAHLLTHDQYVDRYESLDRVASALSSAELAAEVRERRSELLRRLHSTAGRHIGSARRREPDRELIDHTHGPYFMRCISPTSFEAMSGTKGRSVLTTWLVGQDGDDYPAAHEVEGSLERILARFSDATTVFRLRDLGPDAEHPSAGVVHPYLELVIVDLAAHETRLVAAGTD